MRHSIFHSLLSLLLLLLTIPHPATPNPITNARDHVCGTHQTSYTLKCVKHNGASNPCSKKGTAPSHGCGANRFNQYDSKTGRWTYQFESDKSMHMKNFEVIAGGFRRCCMQGETQKTMAVCLDNQLFMG